MKTKRHCIALVTAPDLKTARSLANQVLAAKLAACVNLVPKIESHYWWQGKLEQGNETLLVPEAPRRNLPELGRKLVGLRPYATPEFVVGGLEAGNRRYLDWLSASVG